MCCIVELSLSFFLFFVLFFHILVIISLLELAEKLERFTFSFRSKRVRSRRDTEFSKGLCLQLVEEIRLITVILCVFYVV